MCCACVCVVIRGLIVHHVSMIVVVCTLHSCIVRGLWCSVCVCVSALGLNLLCNIVVSRVLCMFVVLAYQLCILRYAVVVVCNVGILCVSRVYNGCIWLLCLLCIARGLRVVVVCLYQLRSMLVLFVLILCALWLYDLRAMCVYHMYIMCVVWSYYLWAIFVGVYLFV